MHDVMSTMWSDIETVLIVVQHKIIAYMQITLQ